MLVKCFHYNFVQIPNCYSCSKKGKVSVRKTLSTTTWPWRPFLKQGK
uniref:Uncharacterized protein n=1 Tax=Arundo donax TaxID=35708 RepID=A0A0A9FHY2_ARUDO